MNMHLRRGGILILFLIPLAASTLERLPVLESLHEYDTLFQQIRNDIEQAYRVSEQNPPLLLYRYTPSENETIFSIAARLLLPYGTIASLNSIDSATTPIANRSLLIPNQPGLFSADKDRFSDADSHEALSISLRGIAEGWFFLGKDFSAAERRTFFESRFGFPVASPRITSDYGMRISPITGTPLMHNGIDFGGREGTAVLAAADGKVQSVTWSPVLGFYVEIQHDDTLTSIYGHLSQISVNYSQQVRRSEMIGRMGTTGLSTGSHVHFEVHDSGQPVNPFRYLPKLTIQ